jgi:hypothetical protein
MDAPLRRLLAQARTVDVSRPILAFLAGGWVALAAAVILGGFDGASAAAIAALCLVLALLAITGWDLAVRWHVLRDDPVAMVPPDGPRSLRTRLTRHLPPLVVLAAATLLAHLAW